MAPAPRFRILSPALIAVGLSVLIHVTFPLVDLGVAKPAPAMPTSVELVFAPEQDEGDPSEDLSEDDTPDEAGRMPPEPASVAPTLPPPPLAPPVQAPPVQAPPVQAPPPPKTSPAKAQPDPPPPPKAPPADLEAQKRAAAERAALVAQRLEQQRKERAERKARWEAQRLARQTRRREIRRRMEASRHGRGRGKTGNGKGRRRHRRQKSRMAAPNAPDALFLCTAEGRDHQIDVLLERPLKEWVTMLPTVLFPFESRPSLGDYTDGITQIRRRRKSGIGKLGKAEFALPKGVLQLELAQPAGVRVAIGHLDTRCLVGFSYTKGLFPLELRNVPIRIIDTNNNTVTARVNLKFFKDASFELESRNATVLPFTSGYLENHKRIARTINDHYAAAKTLQDIAKVFGVDLVGLAKGRRAERARAAAKIREATALLRKNPPR